jgi:hypothetical protein
VLVVAGELTAEAGEHGAEQDAAAERGGHTQAAAAQPEEDLPDGAAVMPSGRVSVAKEVKPEPIGLPFDEAELSRLDEALTLSSRESGLDFSIYLGVLASGDGEDSRGAAELLHASAPDPADAVLIAVSPGQRVVEIVTGEESSKRVPDRSCKLAVMSMVASFKEDDLTGGLISALRMLTDQAGQPPNT